MIQLCSNFLLLILILGISVSEKEFFTERGIDNSYSVYHQKVILAETLLANEDLDAALDIYEDIFRTYDYVFLREYQLATQIAIKLEKEEAVFFLRKGMEAGWTKKSIRKNDLLKGWLANDQGKALMLDYDTYHKRFLQGINDTLRTQVHEMFKKDQKLALKALFRLSSSAQDKFAEKKFAPHSEHQMHDLEFILDKIGYPGERIIGNNFWMSTILSHHNSISQAYVLADSLYLKLRPKLFHALKKGDMSPQEFALIDEWRMATLTNPTEVSYGFLKAPYALQLEKTDSLRATIGLRSVRLRNQLVEVEEKTGIDLYLFGSPWVDGKIELR